MTASTDMASGTRVPRYDRGMASWRVYLFLVLANLFWSGNYVVGHLLAGGISPLQLTAIRWAIAAPLLIVLAVLLEKPAWRSALREWPMHVLQAALGLVAFCLFSYQALAHTTALNAALVGATNPVLIAIVAALLVRERLRGSSILGLVTSLLGVLLVLTHGNILEVFTTEYNVGGLYMLGAVIVWTAYTILGRTLTTTPVTSAALQSVIAAVALVPLSLALGGPVTLDSAGWWGVLYIGIFPSVLSLMLWNISVRKIGAARAGIYLNLMPVFTALMALAIGTPITLIQILGGALVITGVWLTSRPARRTAQVLVA
ncbi:DMT family transporter [Mycetocola zhadangensis]|uniref:DMT family transporter n=2 Tax=Mycetocola zhadangensis TaxID=1164595 RepID=A0A3L7J568_9MICO|nr:DMT family transporter [Mycetocola zhadangensis]